ncbi:MAG: hypothetical protein F8N36_05730 [Desulfovibrio sp.]|uniref:hypothetical protein n=1 Tax=Desulfovibrio sp. TaxID=885 RepID=UPI00135E7655|nr:hypothetical protein [Desulfovibrio sp.]MTJ92347.1 hypothetical protein [Desulfovibrio sp.]
MLLPVARGVQLAGVISLHHSGIAHKNFSMQYARGQNGSGTVWVFNLVSYVDKNTKYGMILPPQLFIFCEAPVRAGVLHFCRHGSSAARTSIFFNIPYRSSAMNQPAALPHHA